MVSWNRLFGKFVLAATPYLAPFSLWWYRNKFNRKIAIRVAIFFLMTPVIGYFRTPFVTRKFKDQLYHQNSKKETQMKLTLGSAQLDFASSYNNFDYMILVKSERNHQDQELFEKQKTLFILNNQILVKSSEGQNYFEGIKFVYVGEERVFDVLKNNLSKEEDNQFDYINRQLRKGGMPVPRPDSILLISKQENGQNKILMEWPFDSSVNLKTIIRQITKHKHKRYVQSMNF